MQDESVPESVAPPRTRLISFEEGVAAIGLTLMLVQVCTEIVLRDFFNTSFLWSEEVARYQARVAGLAPPDLLAWLHTPR